MADIGAIFNQIGDDIVNALPYVLLAILVIVLGYVVGLLVGKAVKKIMERPALRSAAEQTNMGRSLRSSGMDVPGLMGTIAKVLIVILSIVLAVDILNNSEAFGSYLAELADYLPSLFVGILILVFGVIIADFLASLIGRLIRPTFSPEKGEVADAFRNLLFIGLLAFVLLLALNAMRLPGIILYPLVLGFTVIGVGISLTDVLIRSIIVDHSEFRDVAGYAKFVLYSIFLVVGAGAIFAVFPGVTTIIANISWAFAIALAIMLIPIAYALTNKMTAQMK